MDTTNGWAHFYPSTTAVSTVISTGPSPTEPINNIKGRVGKPARKRTRSSRRASTTILNTDPTNFRAMVQQFTGAPTGPYTDPTRPGNSFGFGDQMQHVVPVGSVEQYRGQQCDAAVIVRGGDASDGFFNSNASGFFLEGMIGESNRSGGYLL